METYQKGGITIDYYGECFGKFDECITGFCEPFRKTKSSLSASFHDKHHTVVTIFTTDLTNWTDFTLGFLLGARQKPDKPLGERWRALP